MWGFIASTRSSCLGRKTNFRRTIKVINQLASRQADRQTDGPTDGQSASRTCSSMQPERRTSWSWCLEDTCRVPCSATWPCSAACTPAGCQPAGRPRSGPGRSVSVHGGSGPGSTTWLVEGGGPLVSSPPLPLSPPAGHWPPAPDPPGLGPVAPLPGLNAVLIGSEAQRAWSIWRRWRTANAFWWRLVLCSRGRGCGSTPDTPWVALCATPPT